MPKSSMTPQECAGTRQEVGFDTTDIQDHVATVNLRQGVQEHVKNCDSVDRMRREA